MSSQLSEGMFLCPHSWARVCLMLLCPHCWPKVCSCVFTAGRGFLECSCVLPAWPGFVEYSVLVSSQLGEYNPFFRDLENEVAEVQPPPVIVYPQSQDQSQNNGAGHYSDSGSVIRPIEPPPHQPVDPRYPPQYDPRFPDTRHTGHTDSSLATHQTENRYPVTPQRRPHPNPHLHLETAVSGVSTTD